MDLLLDFPDLGESALSNLKGIKSLRKLARLVLLIYELLHYTADEAQKCLA